jgi:predicted O-methyltransferase YrrM
LQFAANIEDGAHVTTVDLPPDSAPSAGNNEHDAVLVKASSRQVPRFVDSAHAPRITQRYGDTLKLDFSQLTDSPPDFIFIDAGHTDECVRNDTEKSLAVLQPGGTVIWHDYCQDWPDVFNYLNELGESLPLRKVAGTSLVVYRREFSQRTGR